MTIEMKHWRRHYGALAGSALLIALMVAACPEAAWADAQPETGKQAEAKTKADYLFVQTSKSMTFDSKTKTLTLREVSPVTLFFSDRPERIAGNMRTEKFLPLWSKGSDSFLKDPPNADVSILEGNELHQAVVVLRNPKLEGDALSYNVDVLKGQLPAQGKEVSVFIDVIGMPATPVSYAGVARRTYRRGVIY